MIRRVGVVVSTTVAAGLLSLAVAAPALATPKPDGPPVSGDDRAMAHDKNANSCDDVPDLKGTDSEIILQNDKPTGTSVTIDPEDIPTGFEVTGVVVKGGDAYNFYKGAILDNLVAPINNGGQRPALSHWFVCGVEKTGGSSSTSPSQPPGNGDSSSANPSSSGGSSSSSAPAAQGSNGTVDGDGLANTGFSATGPLIGGGALVLIGSGLLFLLRRTRRNN